MSVIYDRSSKSLHGWEQIFNKLIRSARVTVLLANIWAREWYVTLLVSNLDSSFCIGDCTKKVVMMICEILVMRLRFVCRNIAKCKAVFLLQNSYSIRSIYLNLLWTYNTGTCFFLWRLLPLLRLQQHTLVLLTKLYPQIHSSNQHKQGANLSLQTLSASFNSY